MEKNITYKTTAKPNGSGSIRNAYNKPPATNYTGSTKIVYRLPQGSNQLQNNSGEYDINADKYNKISGSRNQQGTSSKSFDRRIKRTVTGPSDVGQNNNPSNLNDNYVNKGGYQANLGEDNQKLLKENAYLKRTLLEQKLQIEKLTLELKGYREKDNQVKYKAMKREEERKNLEFALSLQREEVEIQNDLMMIDNFNVNNIDVANVGGPNPDNMTYEQ